MTGGAATWTNALLIDHALFRAAWRNLAEVAPGRLYRSNHPLPGALRAAVARHGIRTVINLRGRRDDCGSDVLSRAEAARLGLVHHDAPLESRGAPHRDRLLRLVGLYRESPEPILVHCKSGADRAGLAAGVWLAANGATPAQAAAQLSWRFGHFSKSRTGILDAFFALWAAFHRRHPAIAFERWLALHYDEEGLRPRFRAAGGLSGFLNDQLLRRE
ncbi:MAG: tyrosine-protein phosphatase [Acetobacteraceae bacterium]|nr:tyrosine-protein phosphatase [Acetobacteraceae bacterium]